jgi:hypothetical protein
MRTASRLDWLAAVLLWKGEDGIPGVLALRRAIRNFDHHARRGDPDSGDKKAGLSPFDDSSRETFAREFSLRAIDLRAG